jgi:chromosomal replication initiator protein
LELWNKCSEKLENTLSQEDFNTWIRPLKAKIDKNTLELVAPNDFILDYIKKNHSKEIKKIVKTQSKSNINLVFKTLTKETFIDKYKNNQFRNKTS